MHSCQVCIIFAVWCTCCVKRKSYRRLGRDSGLGISFSTPDRCDAFLAPALGNSFLTRSCRPEERADIGELSRAESGFDPRVRVEWVEGLEFPAQLLFPFLGNLWAVQAR